MRQGVAGYQIAPLLVACFLRRAFQVGHRRLYLAARVLQIARRVELRDIATADDGESDLVHSVP